MEAASRNAKRVVIADNNRQTVQTLEKNSRELGLGQVQTVCSDGIAYLANLKRNSMSSSLIRRLRGKVGKVFSMYWAHA